MKVKKETLIQKVDTVGFEPTTSRKSVHAKRARYPCAKSPRPSLLGWGICYNLCYVFRRVAHVSTVHHDASES